MNGIPPGPIVVALGGNAISPAGEADTIENQFRNTSATTDRLVSSLGKNITEMVIVHGNGPQVGNVVRRVENAQDIAPWLPLDICVADTQGGMGYMIVQCLQNSLATSGIERIVATIVTRVEVDPDDDAFASPSKPIGPSKRLVASPVPIRVLETDAISHLIGAGALLVAGGGGGVPVVRKENRFVGVEAVVDKDLTAGLIARAIGAGTLLILTDVDGIYVDFDSPARRRLDVVGAGELTELADAGQFALGTMAPKVQAAAAFASSGGVAIVAALDDITGALLGTAGTRVVGN